MADLLPRILVLGTELDRVEVHVLAGVAKAGIPIRALLAPGSRHTEFLESNGIPTGVLQCRGRFDLGAIRHIRRELRTGGYDVLHCFSNRTLSNATIASIGLPVRRVAYRGTVGHLSVLDPLSWFTYLNPSLHKIVCVSDAVRVYLERFRDAQKLVTIHKGHDPAWYPRMATRNLSAYGIPNDAFVITCVANMRPVKGVPYLLDAVDLLAAELNPHLLLIGRMDSTTESALQQNRLYPERVHCAGFQESPSLLVSQSDCFVMPSVDREGLPKALLEAMSVEVAPIATSVGGMPEVVIHDENGLLVPPRDVASLAEALTRLARDPALRQRFAQAAKETIASRLNIETSIRKNIEMYRGLLT